MIFKIDTLFYWDHISISDSFLLQYGQKKDRELMAYSIPFCYDKTDRLEATLLRKAFVGLQLPGYGPWRVLLAGSFPPWLPLRLVPS